MKRKNFLVSVWISFLIGGFFFLLFTKEKTLENFLLNILVAALYSFTLAYGNGFINDFLSKRYSWVEETKKRVVTGIIGTVMVNVILVLFCNYVNFIIVQKLDSSLFFKGNLGVFNWFMINIALLISAVLHAKSFMEEWKKSTRNEVTEQKIIAKSASAQFESLKNQLDPHFLFNSLNVLSALIDENPSQAQYFTSSMSKIYRYVLDQKDKELVTVEEELDFAVTYSNLLKMRFEDSVDFKFEVTDKAKKGFVVPLSLQLLLENCIKHNFATPSKPLSIQIFSDKEFLNVENNLQSRESVRDREGIGLSNIVQRYALITERNVFIEKSTEFFKVKIPLLAEKVSTAKTESSIEQAAYDKAVSRLEELKGFYAHLVSYCIFMPLLIFINLYNVPNYHWFYWPLVGWGIGIAVHAVKTFGINNEWEERQIRKYIRKEEEGSRIKEK